MKYRIILSIVAVLLLLLIALWVWVLATLDPLENPLSSHAPMPIVCTLRGCLTTLTWHNHQLAREKFAHSIGTNPPTSAETLTTIIRQELAQLATVGSSITDADARRYREEILNLSSEEQIENSTGLTSTQYDKSVIVPYLQQQNLIEQRDVKTPDELFKQLALQRWVLVLPFNLRWDIASASVTN
jgi:hypothetical protein